MAIELVWSKRASLKFDQINTYLIEEWGEQSAKQFIGKVFTFLEDERIDYLTGLDYPGLEKDRLALSLEIIHRSD